MVLALLLDDLALRNGDLAELLCWIIVVDFLLDMGLGEECGFLDWVVLDFLLNGLNRDVLYFLLLDDLRLVVDSLLDGVVVGDHFLLRDVLDHFLHLVVNVLALHWHVVHVLPCLDDAAVVVVHVGRHLGLLL